MNKKVKQKWIKALRSNKYKQGQGFLKQHDKDIVTHCCLGVLCEVLELKEKDYSNGSIGFCNNKSYNDILLPSGVAKSLGLKNANPKVLFQGQKTDLASLNDDGISFNDIADVIEEQL